jgi:type II secretory pathway pseudopilin PulG
MPAKYHKRSVFENARDERGFSMIEVVIVAAITIIAAAMAVPGFTSINRYLRISGDMRALNATVALAKMRAAQDFTRARAYADLSNNTFHLEFWNKNGNGGAGCWQTDGDAANACTMSTSPVQQLSQGVSFGFGGVGTGNPNPQIPVAQAIPCYKGSAAGPDSGGATANTACVEFNSRGIPVDPSNSGTPTANDALYVTDGNTVYGVTVNAGGLIQGWESPTSSTHWTAR